MSIFKITPDPNKVPNTQKEWDYSQLPKTGREVDPAVKNYHEQQENMLNQQANFLSYASFGVRCTQGKHFPAKAVFACDHCVQQDPIKPDGMVFTPYKYYLCNKCYFKHRTSSLDLPRVLKTYCWNCILEEAQRINLIDPSKCKVLEK